MSELRRLLNRTEVKAVYPDDVEAVLEATGLAAHLTAGKLRCRRCGRVLSRADIACVLRTREGFAALCSDIECCTSTFQETGEPQ
jgi:hypothetical protein